MQLDVRLPMGLLFLILGVILLIYGFVSDPAIYSAHHNYGLNINIASGVVFGVFGLAMLFLAKRGKNKS
ncbi:hypothetical protein OH491_02880 [Termitidicoccus mucosus]|uniref:Uncharacterized protein n=1 Tax=Termitidicoccus mucosus TaxID=1184151 RepID=A0A178ILL4_9BACT|nr:hypothetical protein AW736_06670 [Opitutaceae bacterium TSB47]